MELEELFKEIDRISKILDEMPIEELLEDLEVE